MLLGEKRWTADTAGTKCEQVDAPIIVDVAGDNARTAGKTGNAGAQTDVGEGAIVVAEQGVRLKRAIYEEEVLIAIVVVVEPGCARQPLGEGILAAGKRCKFGAGIREGSSMLCLGRSSLQSRAELLGRRSAAQRNGQKRNTGESSKQFESLQEIVPG